MKDLGRAIFCWSARNEGAQNNKTRNKKVSACKDFKLSHSLFCVSYFLFPRAKPLAINFADARTAIVNPKNGPKSCVAGMLVINNPGRLVCKCSSSTGQLFSMESNGNMFPLARKGTLCMLTL